MNNSQPSLTPEQANEIKRLASLMAMARVRRTVVGLGASGNPKETNSGAERNVRRATDALDAYLKSLIEP